MKNTVYISLVVLAMTLCSCNDKSLNINKNTPVTVSGSIALTKTVFTDQGATVKVAWSANENIKLVDATQSGISAVFSSGQDSDNQTTAEFKGMIDAAEGDRIVAFYPSDLKISELTASVDYSAQKGTLEYMQDSALMYSSATFSKTSTELSFNNAASILKMNLTIPSADEISSVTISSSDNSLANKADLSLAGTSAEWKNKAYGDITVDLENPQVVAADGVLTIYALAIPQTAKGLKITASNAAGTKEYYYETQEDAVFEAGKVNSLTQTLTSKDLTVNLVQRSVFVSSTQIGVTWSITDFTAPETDRADAYIFGIYGDEACTDTLVRWSSAENASMWKWTNPYNTFPELFDNSPRFQFPGLDPNTTYYVKIEDTGKNCFSLNSYKTSASDKIDISSIASGNAAAGQTILYEDFSEITWGGEPVDRCAGFKPADVKTPVSYLNTTGNHASAGSTSATLGACNSGTGYFFDTAKGCGIATSGTRLKDWACRMEDSKSLGMKEFSGMLMIGNSKKCGDIVTPELSPLGSMATITLEFDACPYYESNIEPLTYQVHVFDGVTVSNNIIDYTVAPARSIDGSLTNSYEWQHVSVDIPNVSATSRIGIGPDIADKLNYYHRMYIDNIKITVKNY
ncbi:MAG: fimbrillin family protein [Bacteroidales bacterium]|jgi:hypothetical protein|nr:fimbrillin family protein [Bacteroidales bacterium]MCI1785082.1 fimbrillin family protein [Bacteroidales bacterium]